MSPWKESIPIPIDIPKRRPLIVNPDGAGDWVAPFRADCGLPGFLRALPWAVIGRAFGAYHATPQRGSTTPAQDNVLGLIVNPDGAGDWVAPFRADCGLPGFLRALP